MSATLPIAIPRINRLAGKKAHRVIVQIRVCGSCNVIGPITSEASLATAGSTKGSKIPSTMLIRASRCSRVRASPPAVGSNSGRLIHTLNAPLRDDGQPNKRTIRTKMAHVISAIR